MLPTGHLRVAISKTFISKVRKRFAASNGDLSFSEVLIYTHRISHVAFPDEMGSIISEILNTESRALMYELHSGGKAIIMSRVFLAFQCINIIPRSFYTNG